MIDEWFSYSVFRWTRQQIIFVWANWECFGRGEWPPEPDEYLTDEYINKKWVQVLKKRGSASDAPIGKAQIMTRAYFENPAIVIAEIRKRLDKVSKDARDTLLHELLRLDVRDYEGLSPLARRALDYISGWRRRQTSYADFKKVAKYRSKKLAIQSQI